MLRVRLIPCLDVRNGRTVKGVRFQNLIDSGDPVELALRYADDGADELVWLDIAATVDDQELQLDQISQLRSSLRIPLTVGGGIRGVDDVERLLKHGADKVSMNSAVFSRPTLIEEVARRWGSQCTVVAVDVVRAKGQYEVYSHGGHRDTGRELGDWLKEAESYGAGEFLLTSIDQDGRQEGYDITMMNYARTCTSRPLIASGGAGHLDHFADLYAAGHSSMLVASLLHQEKITIADIKAHLHERGIPVRDL